MSTPEQPATPALTRKQLRDIRNTGATPIVTAEAPTEPAVEPLEATENAPTESDEHRAAPNAAEPVHTPLPRAAAPAVIHDLPGADASVDLGVAPLTRRQARQQERIRTASVPVITPEQAAAHAAAVAQEDAAAPALEVAEPAVSPTGEQTSASHQGADVSSADTGVDIHAWAVEQGLSEVEPEPVGSPHVDSVPETEDTPEGQPDAPERAVVHPQFGAELLAAEPIEAALPPSFDQLISRSATGANGTGNALILSQTPSAPPLVAPVTATGEVLITGTFNLPEGLGSRGHAPGTADGKDVDAVLVDGELPAHSSPTPIAASAAISTVKNGGDIIKPPTPEKGGRLMLTLAITAGVLALALVGVLILAFVTGVF